MKRLAPGATTGTTIRHERNGSCLAFRLLLALLVFVLARTTAETVPLPPAIVIPGFHARGEPLVHIMHRLEELSRRHDPHGNGVSIEIRKADAHADFAPTETQNIEFRFLDTPLADLIRYVCDTARVEFRREHDAYVISDGTVSLKLPTTRSLPVKPEFWQDVRQESGREPDQEGLVSFLHRRCLVPAPGSRFTSDRGATEISVTSCPESLVECERFLRALDYINYTQQVRLDVRALHIDDPTLVLRARAARVMERDTLLDAILAESADTRVLGTMTLRCNPGEVINAAFEATAGGGAVRLAPRLAGNLRTGFLTLSIEYRERAGNGSAGLVTEQCCLVRSGCSVLVHVPGVRGNAAQAPVRPNYLQITAVLFDKETDREWTDPEQFPVLTAPPSSPPVLQDVILPRVVFAEKPLDVCLDAVATQGRALAGDSPLPGIGLITPKHVPGPPRTITMSMERIPLGDVLRYLAMGTGMRFQVWDRGALLADPSIATEPMATAYLPIDEGVLASMAPDPRQFLQTFGVHLPEGATVYCDKRSQTVGMRNTPSELCTMRKIFCVMPVPVFPTQVMVRAFVADIRDPALIEDPHEDSARYRRLRSLLFSQSEPELVDVIHSAELVTLSGVKAAYHPPVVPHDGLPLALSVIPVCHDDGYTVGLTLTWCDSDREVHSEFELWDGTCVVLKQGPGANQTGEPGAGTQRVLVVGPLLLTSGGTTLRAFDDELTSAQNTTRENEQQPEETGVPTVDLEELCDRTLLDRFLIPHAPLPDAVAILREELNRISPEGSVRVLLHVSDLRPPSPPTAEGEFGLGAFGPEGMQPQKKRPAETPAPALKRRVNLDLQHVTLGDALRAMCLQAGVRWRFESGALVIADKSVCFDHLETRFYAVNTNLLRLVGSLSVEHDAEKRTGSEQEGEDGDDSAKPGVDRLRRVFSEMFGLLQYHGARAELYSRTEKLVVHATPADLRMIDKILAFAAPGTVQARISLAMAHEADGENSVPTAALTSTEMACKIGTVLRLTQPFKHPGSNTDWTLRFTLIPDALNWPDLLECAFTAAVHEAEATDGPALVSTGGTLLLDPRDATPVALPLPDVSAGLQVRGSFMDLGGLNLSLQTRVADPARQAAKAGTEHMRSRLGTAIVHDLAFENAPLAAVVDSLRTALRQSAPGSAAGNLILAPDWLQAGHGTDAPPTITMRFDGISVLEVLDWLESACGTPYTVLDTAVVIGGEPAERGVILMPVSPAALLERSEVNPDAHVSLHLRIENLLRDNGVLFLKGDRVFALTAPPGVLVFGRHSFLDAVRRTLQRITPRPVQVAISARLLDDGGRVTASYAITTVSGKPGTCVLRYDGPSHIEITPQWHSDRGRLTLDLSWGMAEGGAEVIEKQVEVIPGKESSIALGPDPASGRARILGLVCWISRPAPEPR